MNCDKCKTEISSATAVWAHSDAICRDILAVRLAEAGKVIDDKCRQLEQAGEAHDATIIQLTAERAKREEAEVWGQTTVCRLTNERDVERTRSAALQAELERLRAASEYTLSKFGDEYEGRLGPLRDALSQPAPTEKKP